MENTIIAISLIDTLAAIGGRFDLDADTLIRYTDEDNIGGHHSDPNKQGWKCAKGIWGVEGQIIYALIRALKPTMTLEIGNCWGTSTKHICTAVSQNGIGQIQTIDIRKTDVVPLEHRHIVTSIQADLFEFDYDLTPPIDFLFEDSFHTADMVAHVWAEFKEHAASGAMIVSHDAGHFRAGAQVREGIERVMSDYAVYLIEPSNCGLAMWRKP